MDNVIFVALFAGLMLLALGYVQLRSADVERIELPDQRSLVHTPPIADSGARVIVGAFAEQLVTALRSGELATSETQARTLEGSVG